MFVAAVQCNILMGEILMNSTNLLQVILKLFLVKVQVPLKMAPLNF